VEGGWFVCLVHLVLLGAFIAASGIDLELWIIPLSICWLVTIAGFIGSAVGGYLVAPEAIRDFGLLPVASAGTAALAVGASVGLGIAWVLLKTGLLKRSYDLDEPGTQESQSGKKDEKPPKEPEYNHRFEALKEIVFLLPIIICAVIAWAVLGRSAGNWWAGFVGHPVVAGLLGSIFGYFVGCAVVWATRILGTLGFGKEAMGLGDVHLMGAAGAVIGPLMVVIAFFVAPFFGLGWALFQMFFKKIRQIPYGPFLSLAVLTVMIFHDWIMSRFAILFLR
jgi:leader peptidase (prepilin peptidase)/N-methyltransferase